MCKRLEFETSVIQKACDNINFEKKKKKSSPYNLHNFLRNVFCFPYDFVLYGESYFKFILKKKLLSV